MVTATKTKRGVEAAEAELAGAQQRRGGLDKRLESANEAQAGLRRRRQEVFASGKDTADLFGSAPQSQSHLRRRSPSQSHPSRVRSGRPRAFL